MVSRMVLMPVTMPKGVSRASLPELAQQLISIQELVLHNYKLANKPKHMTGTR